MNCITFFFAKAFGSTTNNYTASSDSTITSDPTIISASDLTTTTVSATYFVFLTNVVKISPILKNKAYGPSPALCLDIDPYLIFQVATNTVSC